MTQQDLAKAKDPDLEASLRAIKRAAVLARKTAIQTDTGIVIVEDGKIVYVSAEQLQREQKE
jgi:imidazolonepropionase-like amidohydrolase